MKKSIDLEQQLSVTGRLKDIYSQLGKEIQPSLLVYRLVHAPVILLVRAKAGFDSQAESFFGNTLTDRHTSTNRADINEQYIFCNNDGPYIQGQQDDVNRIVAINTTGWERGRCSAVKGYQSEGERGVAWGRGSQKTRSGCKNSRW